MGRPIKNPYHTSNAMGPQPCIPYHPIVWDHTPISHTIPYLFGCGPQPPDLSMPAMYIGQGDASCGEPCRVGSNLGPNAWYIGFGVHIRRVEVPSASQSHACHRIPVIESCDQTDGVRQRSTRHEYVHDLVARAVDVECPWIPLLRQAGGVDDGARPVQEAQTQKVREGHASVLRFPAVERDAVDDGDKGRETEESEHGRSHDAVGGTAKAGLHG